MSFPSAQRWKDGVLTAHFTRGASQSLLRNSTASSRVIIMKSPLVLRAPAGPCSLNLTIKKNSAKNAIAKTSSFCTYVPLMYKNHRAPGFTRQGAYDSTSCVPALGQGNQVGDAVRRTRAIHCHFALKCSNGLVYDVVVNLKY